MAPGHPVLAPQQLFASDNRCYLRDVDEAMGPMGVCIGSHKQGLSSLRDEQGKWTGALSDAELANLNPNSIGWCHGPRGTVTVHHCRAVHGSPPNRSPRMRPLLLHTYAAANAVPLTSLMEGIPYSGVLVRGQEQPAVYDSEPCPLPPDFRATGYSSIFASQGKSEV